MEKLQLWIASRRGRAAQMAAALAVPASFVTKMATGARPIPVAHMARIEELTGGYVTRKDLRPDDWHDIWPELAQQAPAAIDSEASAAAQEVAHG